MIVVIVIIGILLVFAIGLGAYSYYTSLESEASSRKETEELEQTYLSEQKKIEEEKAKIEEEYEKKQAEMLKLEQEQKLSADEINKLKEEAEKIYKEKQLELEKTEEEAEKKFLEQQAQLELAERRRKEAEKTAAEAEKTAAEAEQREQDTLSLTASQLEQKEAERLEAVTLSEDLSDRQDAQLIQLQTAQDELERTKQQAELDKLRYQQLLALSAGGSDVTTAISPPPPPPPPLDKPGCYRVGGVDGLVYYINADGNVCHTPVITNVCPNGRVHIESDINRVKEQSDDPTAFVEKCSLINYASDFVSSLEKNKCYNDFSGQPYYVYADGRACANPWAYQCGFDDNAANWDNLGQTDLMKITGGSTVDGGVPDCRTPTTITVPEPPPSGVCYQIPRTDNDGRKYYDHHTFTVTNQYKKSLENTYGTNDIVKVDADGNQCLAGGNDFPHNGELNFNCKGKLAETIPTNFRRTEESQSNCIYPFPLLETSIYGGPTGHSCQLRWRLPPNPNEKQEWGAVATEPKYTGLEKKVAESAGDCRSKCEMDDNCLAYDFKDGNCRYAKTDTRAGRLERVNTSDAYCGVKSDAWRRYPHNNKCYRIEGDKIINSMRSLEDEKIYNSLDDRIVYIDSNNTFCDPENNLPFFCRGTADLVSDVTKLTNGQSLNNIPFCQIPENIWVTHDNKTFRRGAETYDDDFTKSFAECKEKCVRDTNCVGVEYSEAKGCNYLPYNASTALLDPLVGSTVAFKSHDWFK